MATLVAHAARGSRRRLTHWLSSSSSSSSVLASRNGDGGRIAKLSTSARLEQQSNQASPPKRRPRRWLQPAAVGPALEVPPHIPRPPAAAGATASEESQIHGEEGAAGMRAAGRLAARVRDYVGTLVQPGVTTDEIDKAAHEAIVAGGAYPALLGFGGFPKSVSTSVNECICNGIPDARPLEEGDIVNINVHVYLNGYHSTTSETFICGRVHPAVRQFVETDTTDFYGNPVAGRALDDKSSEYRPLLERSVTRDCLDTAVAICGPGVDFRDIGSVITDIADGCDYRVVEHVVGHGVGSVFRSAPAIYHHYNYKSGRMVVGQTFTIEPAVSMGSTKAMQWDDKWTTVTVDGSLSAQFKHALLITESGAEILTPNKEVEVDESEEQLEN